MLSIESSASNISGERGLGAVSRAWLMMRKGMKERCTEENTGQGSELAGFLELGQLGEVLVIWSDYVPCE